MNFGTRFIARYVAAIQWFIPPDARKDAATLTRAQNVINAVVMAALSGPLYAYTYDALGYGAAARVILTCCLGMFAAPFLMRATKSIVIGREVFLCAVFFNFSWLTYAMGGVSAPTAGWMVIPPMVAIFLGGFATGMFWLGLTCATIVFIYALPLLGIPLPTHPIQDMELLYVLCDFGLYVVIVFFALLLDVTRIEGFVKLQHALDFMRDVALRDGVTGSHKRGHTLRLLAEERERVAAKGTTCSLCLLEIDHFKSINAAHGQAAGDLVLREVASCAGQFLRDTDASGRYGAAQLLLILPETTQHDALLLAERVRQRVPRLRFASIPAALELTVSIGVAQLLPGESIGQTLARADEALYQAASGGRNRVAGYGQPAEPGQSSAAPEQVDGSRIDALTGALSRRVLRDRLGHAMARALRNGRAVGLMLLNVNKLGDINASFGIEGGDAVLAQAAAQVRACLHVADTLVRWSGDEFIVILEDLDNAGETQQLAQRILDRFAFPLLVGERECAVSLSIGIAMFPAPSCDMDTLLERAGLAMTRARNLGGNMVQTYALDAIAAADEHLALKNDLHEALGAQQLQLAYRPQVDLGSGEVVGVEALVRWAHPQHGPLEAARFMPLAEETGLADPIFAWALRSACLQNAAWRAAGLPPVRTALKLSAAQLAHPGVAERILAVVRDTGIDPHCLALHIAEAALAGEQPLHEAVLGRLRRAGVHVCIDDFGLGGAGLRYLAAPRVDTLKLGSGFVGRLGQPQRDDAAWALAESIIDLAHRLHLGVIAEAVDTPAQLADLRAMGCDAAQGAVVGHPCGADAMAQLLERPLMTPRAACPT